MVYKKSNNIDVKKINKNIIYKYILENKKVSKNNISISLNISMPTVWQNLKELLDCNLIQEVGEFESSGGRKAKAISIVENAKFAIGVDITKNHVSIVLVNLVGDVVKNIRLKKTFSYTKGYFLWFEKSIKDFILGIDMNSILGVGISIPAIIDKSGSYITSSHVLKLKDVPCNSFSEYIPFNCIFMNDANAAGFAESKYIENNAIYLSLSNSVGGAIILSKKLYTGDNVRAGEFGHAAIIPDGEKCYCGKRGCLDCYCKASLLSDLTNGKLNIFFDKLNKGDKKIIEVWDKYLYYLSIAVNNLRMNFDCDVVIGGYVGAYFLDYLNDFKDKVSKLNTFENNANYIRVCKHHFEGAALGAALVHIDSFIKSV
ncbi:ROK family transcriptional regulator [Brachyspira pilosicoli]|uniref:ROK family transcriptional regulator n=1 Tax=Brachyspira pilosicoli TaxID=52584 RepID=UPI003003B2CD